MKYKITSEFLQQESFRNHPHNGVDFSMPIGSKIHSVSSGIVHLKNFGNQNAGKTVLIEGEDGKTFIYGHLSKFKVHEGQLVNQGDLIGLSGNTGHSTGAHLHFGIKSGGGYINPSDYISSIQNMNHHVVTKTQYLTTSFSDLFNNQMDIYKELIESMKLHLINLSMSVDYTMFLEYFQHFFKFFS